MRQDSTMPFAPRFTAVQVARALRLEHDPTPEQAAVIEAPLRPLVVVAGAGSGKTETMAARVVWLVANGLVAPDEVLGLTFTRKAASELAARVERRLLTLRQVGLWAPAPVGAEQDGSGGQIDPFAGRPTISTYHSYAGRIVGDYGLRVGVEPTVRLLTEAATWQLAYESAVRYDGDLSDFDLTETSLANAVLNLSGELAEHLLDRDAAQAYFRRCAETLEGIGVSGELKTVVRSLRARCAALDVAGRYARLKTSRDAMDFADQLAVAARLATQFPDIAEVEQDRFKVVLLDEFQDTSHAQLELLRSLFAQSAVTAVGDPHQSIYGWRGASATTLASFQDAFHREGDPVPTLPLATSWRNAERILTVANAVAAPLRAGLSVPVPELAARPGAPSGAVFAARYETDRAEAQAVARWLDDRGAGREGVSAAVLCRKRRQFRPIMEALEASGVPYEVVGLGGLLLTPEVEDVVALLHVVHDPTRGEHLMRLLLGPLVRIGAADLDGLWAYARARQRIRAQAAGEMVRDQARDSTDTATLAEALEDLPPARWVGPRGESVSELARERLGELAAVVRGVRMQSALPLPDLVSAAERALGLDIEVAARPGYYLSAARAHLDAFVDVAAEFAASADRVTLGPFLAWLEAAEEHERGLETRSADSAEGPVSIMTIHAAKGLEWDLVAVPGLVEATFPSHNSATSTVRDGRWGIGPQTGKGWLGSVTTSGIPHSLRGDRSALPDLDWRSLPDAAAARAAYGMFTAEMGDHAMAEERRLAYVAFTRAKEQLLLTASVWGPQKSPRVTSRFLIDALDSGGLLEPAPERRGTQLDEGRLDLGRPGPVTVLTWAPMPSTQDVAQPRETTVRAALWPSEPEQSAARTALLDTADQVRAAAGRFAASESAGWARVEPDDAVRVAIERILARERAERDLAAEAPALEAISASNLVLAARSPDRFAQELRRPMPSAPNRAARRGTRFHAFVEQHYGHAAMLEWDDLPGSADVDAFVEDERDLAAMKAHFLGSEWADRTPLAIETDVETVLPTAGGPVSVRGRIDAVFPAPGGGVTIVDWKSGGPGSVDDVAARAIQLGVYALAWERIHSLEPGTVRVAFYFAATGRTLWPDLPTQAEIIALLEQISP
ncbi:MAG: ATP-dependent DNA helicase [Actinomycetia bacterium]|nr:ATP-dependent DNA helicase [Actinomycetes bacterium]